jgi:hypothetical protein
MVPEEVVICEPDLILTFHLDPTRNPNSFITSGFGNSIHVKSLSFVLLKTSSLMAGSKNSCPIALSPALHPRPPMVQYYAALTNGPLMSIWSRWIFSILRRVCVCGGVSESDSMKTF